MLKVVVVNSHLVFAALLNQVLAILSKLVVIGVVRLEHAFESLQIEVLETIQITVLHHYLQDQAQLTHSLTQGLHAFVE